MALTAQALTLFRGDSKAWNVVVTDGPPDNTADPANSTNKVNLDEDLAGNPANPAILKFAVKVDPDDPNDTAVVFKTSYDPLEIEILTQTGADVGLAVVHTQKVDTVDTAPSDKLAWDLELYRQGDPIVDGSPGTIEVTAGSGTVTGTGTLFTKAKEGAILIPAGGSAPNLKPVTVTKVVSDTELETDYTAWDAESGITYILKFGDSKTTAFGSFDLKVDQVR